MKVPWPTYVSEFVGTALLIIMGLSFVIFDFGSGSPVVALLPDPGTRRAITGFFFGATGALIAVSPVGKISGAHINPVVTLAFHLKGKMALRDTIAYIVAQFAGAVAGAVPLWCWGPMGRSVNYGVTVPGPGDSVWAALCGEAVTTIGLIVGLFVFLGHKKLRQFTPLLFPFLYSLMVYLEAPLSGTSTNPARSVGPAVVADVWTAWWIYFVGPLAGMLIGIALHEFTWLGRLKIGVAKIYHFDHDRYGVFGRRKQETKMEK
ncbi:MAG TPA: aquaporin [Verrucomicrobiae bacterium]|nr:aquaporin [Verrucomicrobiae bacterium]